jgi:hypothetical protein
MTETLIDPRDAFLEEGLNQALTVPERELVDYVANRQSNNTLEVAAALGVAFLAYRFFMKRHVAKEMEDKANRTNLENAIDMSWKVYKRGWVKTVSPHILAGFEEGVREVIGRDVPRSYLLEIAEGYSGDLGDHINDVSKKAMLDGFQAQINRKVPPARALQRVLTAFGVTPRAMNSLVSVWLSDNPKKLSAMVFEDAVEQRGKTIINADVMKRGKMIGDNEAWGARSQAKQIVWMYGQEQGTIPKNATRRWVTADDEKVCPTCGPLHQRSVPLNKQFESAGEKAWAPPLHVNCRCDIELDWADTPDLNRELRLLLEGELVTKARGTDPYDRDQSGRFARQESRQTKPKLQVKERSRVRHKYSPEVQQAMLKLEQDATKAEIDEMLDRAFKEQAKPSEPPMKPKLKPVMRKKSILRDKPLIKPDEVAEPTLSEAPEAQLKQPQMKPPRMKPVKLTTKDVNLIAPQDAKTSKSTNLGDYDTLSKPVAILLEQGDVQLDSSGAAHFYMGEDEPDWTGFDEYTFEDWKEHGAWGINIALKTYWDNWSETHITEFQDELANDDGYMIKTLHNGVHLYITEDAYRDALEYAVMRDDHFGQHELQLNATSESFAEPFEMYVTVNSLADALQLTHKANDQRPIIAVTYQLFQDAKPKYDENMNLMSATNPGRWAQSSPVTHTVDQAKLNYLHKLIYVDPVDVD